MMKNTIHEMSQFIKYYPHSDWSLGQIQADLADFAQDHIKQIWLIYDAFYDAHNTKKLRQVLDYACEIGLVIFPTVGQYILVSDCPSAKMVNQSCLNPPTADVGCLRHPKVLQIAIQRTQRFFAEFGHHPALHRIGHFPLMTFFHEPFDTTSSNQCYCDYCHHAHRMDYPITMTTVDDTSWRDCQFDAIPEFLSQLMQATRAEYPVWVTYECRELYPNFAQSVFRDNEHI